MSEFPIHDSPHFDVREWVDERTWAMLGPKAAWQIDPRIVRVADLLRQFAGRGVVINNWHYRKSGNKYQSSGLRAVWDNTGAALSQHRRGCAADLKIPGLTPVQMFDILRDNRPAFLAAGLTTVENIAFTSSWLHCDVRPSLPGIHPSGDFLIVDPA